MAQVYNYTISTAFPNQKVDPSSLASQIAAALPLPAPQLDDAAGGIGVRVTGSDNCDIWFTAALDAAQKLTLDGVVAAHSGFGTVASCFAATTLPDNLGHVIAVPGPEILMGIITTPSWYAPVDQVVGKFLGDIKTDGADAEMQIVEEITQGPNAGQVNVLGVDLLPNTGGLWTPWTLNTDQIPSAETWNRYTIVIDKRTTPNVELRYSSFSMLHVQIV